MTFTFLGRLGGENFFEEVGGSVANLIEDRGIGKEGFEFGGHGSFVGEVAPGNWVGEAQPPGVEHEATGMDCLSLDVCVNWISEQWTAEVLEVNANLMRAPGVEMAQHEAPRRVILAVENVVVGDGGLARSLARVEDRLLLSIDGMTANVREDRSVGLNGSAFGGGKIEFGGAAFGELLEE